jgi:hypothetical protein
MKEEKRQLIMTFFLVAEFVIVLFIIGFEYIKKLWCCLVWFMSWWLQDDWCCWGSFEEFWQ